MDYGATSKDIAREAKPERLVTLERLLADMQQSGLVERKPDPHNKNTKPFFITKQGTAYLEDACGKALIPEIGQRRAWSVSRPDADLQQVVSEVLRALPEFQGRGEERIHEVTGLLIQRLHRDAINQR